MTLSTFTKCIMLKKLMSGLDSLLHGNKQKIIETKASLYYITTSGGSVQAIRVFLKADAMEVSQIHQSVLINHCKRKK